MVIWNKILGQDMHLPKKDISMSILRTCTQFSTKSTLFTLLLHYTKLIQQLIRRIQKPRCTRHLYTIPQPIKHPF